jgi:hypothetical protein
VSGYPLLNVFLTIMWFSIWLLWLFLLVRVILDLFRSHDLSGLAKAGWLAFVIILPFLGVLIYLIARGKTMAEHDEHDGNVEQQAFDQQVRQAGGEPASAADELTKLADLHARGVLSDAEYEAQKAKALA